MQFLSAPQGPFVVQIGGQSVAIPRFTRADRKVWAAEIDAARRKAATEGMSQEDRFQSLAFFPLAPTTPGELRQYLGTDEGDEYVIRKCLKKVPAWDDAKVTEFLDANPQEDLTVLARELFSDRPKPPPPPKTTAPTTDKPQEEKPPQSLEEEIQRGDSGPLAPSESGSST